MKIAVLTSGILPVPSVEGGAVENLIDFYLDYNDKHHQHDITIYSIFNPLVKRYQALQSSANHYRYINSNTLFAKIGKRIYRWIHGRSYYHDTIQYYLYRTISQMKKSSFDFIIVIFVIIVVTKRNIFWCISICKTESIYNKFFITINLIPS